MVGRVFWRSTIAAQVAPCHRDPNGQIDRPTGLRSRSGLRIQAVFTIALETAVASRGTLQLFVVAHFAEEFEFQRGLLHMRHGRNAAGL
jgi:acetolactate synthase small subunit